MSAHIDALKAALVGKTVVDVERVGDWDEDSEGERVYEVIRVEFSDGSDAHLSCHGGDRFYGQLFVFKEDEAVGSWTD